MLFTILQVSRRSAVSNAEVDKIARFSLVVLAFVSDVLLSSVQISACLKQVCLFLISILKLMNLHNFLHSKTLCLLLQFY